MARNKKKRITSGGSVGSSPTQTIILQPTRRGGLGVPEYMNAIKSAELIDYPRRAKLIDLYEDVSLDSHLFAVLRKQKAAILSTPIKFQREGKIDEQMQTMIDSPWFGRFVEDLIDDEWRGVGGSLFQFYREPNGWINYDLIPRKHVDAVNRKILRYQGDTNGKDWDEFSDLLYIGNPRQIGSLAVAAFWVILKRNNVGDWAELGEIFGRPIREGTYDAWDEEARQRLVEDILNMGGAGIFIHPEGTKLNLIQAPSIGAGGEIYEKFHNVCNSEISKVVNGNTLTTEAGDKGTQALGAVQQEGEQDIAFFIKRRILNVLNYELTDIFASMGINTSGGSFLFVPPQKKDPKQRVDVICRLKQVGLPISDDYLYEEFGIPKPDNYDQLKAEQTAQQEALQALAAQRVATTAQGDPQNEAETVSFRDKVLRFFGTAPASAGADLEW